MDILARLRDCVDIAHHVPGRIRLKLKNGGAALQATLAAGVEAARFGGALDAVPGVRRIHFNKLARSLTVEYDNRAIPDCAWPDLLANRSSPEAAALLNRLQEHYRQALET
ncbi:MAG: cation transporter [Azoarcus sp.]|nr:cation transporter [Azoarcus sp.]